jgi:hypothetical protein
MSNEILNLKKMISVYLQINEINALLTKNIKEDEFTKNKQYYLINKDIVSFYLNSKEIEEYTKNQTLDNFNQNLNEISEKINNDKNIKCEIPNNINMLLNDIEKLKIDNKEFLYNFFIVRKDVLEILLDKSNKDNNDEENINDNNAIFEGFVPYNILIGIEGIYIWNKENKVNQDHKENKEIVVHFLDVKKLESNLQNFRLKRVYIFNTEEVFNNELKNNILGKSIFEYISSRNIITSKNKVLNLIDNGNVIGEYINIMRGENFHDNSGGNIEGEKIKSRFDSFVEDIEKNIDEFLIAFLVNCYYIEELREEVYKNNSIDKNDTLTSKLREFFLEFENNKNTEIQINNFIKLFKTKFSEELLQFNSKKIINPIIIKVMSIIYEENESNEKILELFFGDKNFISKSTKEILFSSNSKEIYDSNQLYYYSLPTILFLNDNNSAINSLELNTYQYLNGYDLISCIKSAESGFESIIKKENNYEKIIVYSKDEKKYEFSDIQSTNIQDEKENSVISIFKRKSKIEKIEYNDLLGETMREINISDYLSKSKMK